MSNFARLIIGVINRDWLNTKGRALVIPRLGLKTRGDKTAPRFPTKAERKRARLMGSGWW